MAGCALVVACAAVTGLGDYVIEGDSPDAATAVDSGPKPLPAADTGAPGKDATPPGPCTVCDVVVSSDVRDVATSPTSIFWTDSHTTLHTANLDGTNARELVSGEAVPVAGIEFRSDHVFWSAAGLLRRMPADRDGSVETIGIKAIEVGCIHFGNARLLVTSPDAGEIYNPELDGGGAGVLGRIDHVWGIDANNPDASFLTTYEPNGGAVLTKILGVAADAGFTLVYPNQHGPRCLAVDERDVFWANHDSGEIMHGTFEAAPATVLASGQTLANGISFQSPWLYWSWSGGIRRLRIR